MRGGGWTATTTSEAQSFPKKTPHPLDSRLGHLLRIGSGRGYDGYSLPAYGSRGRLTEGQEADERPRRQRRGWREWKPRECPTSLEFPRRISVNSRRGGTAGQSALSKENWQKATKRKCQHGVLRRLGGNQAVAAFSSFKACHLRRGSDKGR